jgi:hypothetical protein
MSELVSTLQFPDNREITGNFSILGRFPGFLLPIDKQIQPLAAKFRGAWRPGGREAYRMVAVREGDKIRTLPAIQAVLRSLVALAVKGNGPAQRTLFETVQAIEAQQDTGKDGTPIQREVRFVGSELARRIAFLLRTAGSPEPWRICSIKSSLDRDDRLDAQPKEELIDAAFAGTRRFAWVPNPGPQSDAYFCQADELFYGGQAGGGEDRFGARAGAHRTSAQPCASARQQECGEAGRALCWNRGPPDGYSGQLQRWRLGDRLIEFAGCEYEEDKQRFKCDPHDLIYFDEGTDFLALQYRFHHRMEPLSRWKAALPRRRRLEPADDAEALECLCPAFAVGWSRGRLPASSSGPAICLADGSDAMTEAFVRNIDRFVDARNGEVHRRPSAAGVLPGGGIAVDRRDPVSLRNAHHRSRNPSSLSASSGSGEETAWIRWRGRSCSHRQACSFQWGRRSGGPAIA